jgi:uncharacterized OB-fold protein
MSLSACVNCGQRYATEVAICRSCGQSVFRASPVLGEMARVEAVTVLHAGVADGPVTLVIAGLRDVAVLASASGATSIGDAVGVSDLPDGGFVAVAADPALSPDRSGSPRP